LPLGYTRRRLRISGGEHALVRRGRDAPKEANVTTATLTDADIRVRDAVMRQLDWQSFHDSKMDDWDEIC
jgi:hypothetical protein